MADGDDRELMSLLEKRAEKAKAKMDEIEGRMRKGQAEWNEWSAEYEPAIKLIQRLKGTNKTKATVEQPSFKDQEFSQLSIKEAALRILEETRRPMSSGKLVEEMRKRGKPMESTHSVYMVSMALKTIPEKVQKSKRGRSNFFELKHQLIEDKK